MVHHATEHKVRWSEVDPAGIVFYPRFFEWFDQATEALFESLERDQIERGVIKAA